MNGKCECSMSISLLGDGCRYCQPQEYIDRLHESIEEDRAEVEELATLKQELRALREQKPCGKIFSESEMGIGWDRKFGNVIWWNKPAEGLIYAAPMPAREGWKLVPSIPTEEMIQHACLSQSIAEYDSYQEWWESHSSGISDRIRNYIIRDYKAMLEAAPKL